jgi:hypothetical protein
MLTPSPWFDVLLTPVTTLFNVLLVTQANGENNNDGCNDNFSWNCGHEGNTSVSVQQQQQPVSIA